MHKRWTNCKIANDAQPTTKNSTTMEDCEQVRPSLGFLFHDTYSRRLKMDRHDNKAFSSLIIVVSILVEKTKSNTESNACFRRVNFVFLFLCITLFSDKKNKFYLFFIISMYYKMSVKLVFFVCSVVFMSTSRYSWYASSFFSFLLM